MPTIHTTESIMKDMKVKQVRSKMTLITRLRLFNKTITEIKRCSHTSKVDQATITTKDILIKVRDTIKKITHTTMLRIQMAPTVTKIITMSALKATKVSFTIRVIVHFQLLLIMIKTLANYLITQTRRHSI